MGDFLVAKGPSVNHNFRQKIPEVHKLSTLSWTESLSTAIIPFKKSLEIRHFRLFPRGGIEGSTKIPMMMSLGGFLVGAEVPHTLVTSKVRSFQDLGDGWWSYDLQDGWSSYPPERNEQTTHPSDFQWLEDEMSFWILLEWQQFSGSMLVSGIIHHTN